jgi:hypothetical protein
MCRLNAQSNDRDELTKSNRKKIVVTWGFDYETDHFSQELIFRDDGSFSITSLKQNQDPIIQKGKYTISSNSLSMEFDADTRQVNTIEVLSDNELKYVYIETVYKYYRWESDD